MIPCECGAGASDGNGVVLLPLRCPHHDRLHFFDPAGALIGANDVSWAGAVLPQRSGFVSVGRDYLGPWSAAGVRVRSWNSSGSLTGEQLVRAAVAGTTVTGVVAGSGFAGGAVLAGDIAASADPSTPLTHAVAMFTGGDEPFVGWGPRPLASSGAVLAAAVDLRGRTLVITEASRRYGLRSLSGQWFDNDGTPITGEFPVASSVPAGESDSLEVSPVLGGGVLVTHVASERAANGSITNAGHPLAIVASGESTLSPAPAWLISRPNVRLAIARGGTGYAMLPRAAAGVPCTQQVELVAPDGTSCGREDYRIADGLCDTQDIGWGADGTLVQLLPLSMEERSEAAGTHSCSWRWWPPVSSAPR